jgi:hypothetical protein
MRTSFFRFLLVLMLAHSSICVLHLSAQSSKNLPTPVGTLQSVLIQNDGRVELRFTKLPKEYSTELSADKKKLTLRLTEVGVDDRARDVLAKGNVDNVFIKTIGKGTAEIYIMLKTKRGYSIEPLPYSDVLAVNFFDWNTLPVQDNSYHSGLLAIESKTFALAKEYFGKADQMNMGNASAMLGLTAIREGDAREAQRNFQRAIANRSSIPDVFAGLADLYGAIGDTLSRNEYANKFRERSGRADYPRLVQFIIPPDALFIEPRSVADRIRDDGYTVGQQSGLDSTQRDSALREANRRADSTLNSMVQQQAQQLAKPQQVPVKDSTSARSLAPQWLGTAVWSSLIGMTGLGIIGIWLVRRAIKKKKAKPSTLFATDSMESGRATSSGFAQEELDALTELLAQEHIEAVRKKKTEGSSGESATLRIPSAQPPSSTTSEQAEQPLRSANARNAAQAYLHDQRKKDDQEKAAKQTAQSPSPASSEDLMKGTPASVRSRFGIDAGTENAFEKLSGKAPLSMTPVHEEPLSTPPASSTPLTGQSNFFEPPDNGFEAPQQQQTPGDLDELDDISRKLRRGRSEIELALNLVTDPDRSMDFKDIPIDSQEIPDRDSDQRTIARELGIGKGELEIKKNLSPLDVPSPDNSRKKNKLSSLFSKPDDEK